MRATRRIRTVLRALNPQCSAARFKSASASLLASSACHSAASVKARVHDAARHKLPPSHVDDALAQRLRFGRRRRLGQFRERHGRHLDVHVEAIGKRSMNRILPYGRRARQASLLVG